MLIKVDKSGIATHRNLDRTLSIDTINDTLFIEDREQYLAKIKRIRPDVWKKEIEHRIQSSTSSKAEIQTLKDLFCSGRIDAKRALEVARGNVKIEDIHIDEEIMRGNKKNIQVYTDEWFNADQILFSLKKKYDMDGVYTDDPKEIALYEKEKKRLRRQGKLRPGIVGI
jgi:hypothetical protein